MWVNQERNVEWWESRTVSVGWLFGGADVEISGDLLLLIEDLSDEIFLCICHVDGRERWSGERQAAAALTNRVIANTTVLVSNVVGPEDEISFFGHSMVFAAPAVYGVGHALTIHFQSYCNKMTISMAVDPEVISDPYQLCDDLEHSLEMFKEALKISTKKVVVLDVDDASYLSIV
ncbi:unnamed protein product [Cuscuta campestris]|uniref:O-acyltransferase WSD1 C-terminal domain-containing protein n=1 Tax=Cuscuta campestris TaxID=132261 RepID=A0A484NCY2_9ASTE|nr:unnamed protein product [Cuscuta campestris]